MVVRNGMSRYHLCIQALRRVVGVYEGTSALLAECNDKLTQHQTYVREHLEDMPEIRDWVWSDEQGR